MSCLVYWLHGNLFPRGKGVRATPAPLIMHIRFTDILCMIKMNHSSSVVMDSVDIAHVQTLNEL